MRYLHFAFSIVALSAVHIAAVAGAQSDDRGHGDFVQRIFESADTDSDGVLTFAEFKAHVVAHTTNPNRPANAPPPPTEEMIAEHFTAIDTDESGTLTFAEFQARHRPPHPHRDR